MNEMTFWAFCDELEKIAAKIPVMHGTSGRWAVLRPRVGAAIFGKDPNEAALYLATWRHSVLKGVSGFAHEAVRKKGGEPVIGLAKVDTKKGWTARTLSDWGKKNIGSLEDARDLVAELDQNPTRERRKEIWQAVQQRVDRGPTRRTRQRRSSRPNTTWRPTPPRSSPVFVGLRDVETSYRRDAFLIGVDAPGSEPSRLEIPALIDEQVLAAESRVFAPDGEPVYLDLLVFRRSWSAKSDDVAFSF